MGAGKTESAISMMQEDTNSNYIFLTPYLNEVERIKKNCPNRHFVSPENKGKGKLDSLHYWLGKNRNIASTHALFSTYSEYTTELIRNGQYKLILDEVFDVVEPMPVKKKDIDVLFNSGLAKVADDNEHVEWLADDYDGTKFQDVMQKAKSNNLIFYKDSLLFWNFPVNVFDAFQEVIILTYMFDSQPQKYYYDMNNITVEYIGTHKIGDKFKFCDAPVKHDLLNSVASKIHILEDDKMNQIGDYEFALSSTWFQREKKKKEKPLIQMLKRNIINLYNNKYRISSSCAMWTTFKDYKGLLSGKGYTTGFVSCNVRATNEYRNKTHLAYCVNVFFNPMFKHYFEDHGAKVDEDGYALSEMIQWIWRSAIRDGKEIWIYIPSSRMRRLLTEWMEKCKLDM